MISSHPRLLRATLIFIALLLIAMPRTAKQG